MKYSKEKVKVAIMGNNLEYEGVSGAWVRFCIGAGILMLAAAPLVSVLRWW